MSLEPPLDGARQAEAAAPAPPARGLEMRAACERCGTGLAPDGEAVICSYECTFCSACAEAIEHACPNCGGELVARPKRAAA